MSDKTNTKKQASPSNNEDPRKKDLLSALYGDKDENASKKIDYAARFSSPTRDTMNPLDETRIRDEEIDLSRLRAAPEDWNFYSKLPDHKIYQMVESIERIGLQHKIIVWENSDKETFTILSGHNRFRAFEMLYDVTEEEKYKKIPATIYPHDLIDVADAEEVIIDTNWIQRELSPYEKSRSITAKMAVFNSKHRKSQSTGRARDLVGEKYNLTGRMIDNYIKLTDLAPPFMEMLNDRKLSIVSGARLAGFDKKTQLWIFGKYIDVLTNPLVGKLRKDMPKDEISAIFDAVKDKPHVALTMVKVEIPYGYEEKFRALFEDWVEKESLKPDEFKIYIK